MLVFRGFRQKAWFPVVCLSPKDSYLFHNGLTYLVTTPLCIVQVLPHEIAIIKEQGIIHAVLHEIGDWISDSEDAPDNAHAEDERQDDPPALIVCNHSNVN